MSRNASRYLLRSLEGAIHLPRGETSIGRGTDCDILLDDPMVSRVHAVVRVLDDGNVTVEDKGSRNGTIVNGERIASVTSIEPGARLTFGSHLFTLIEEDRELRSKMSTWDRPAPTSDLPADVDEFPDESSTNNASLFGMFASACDRAMERGSLGEAGFAASNLFVSLRAALVRGQPVDEDTIGLVRRYALLLAERTGEVRWVDRLYELYGVLGRVMEPETIGRIHKLAQRQGFPATHAFRGYLARVRASTDQLDEEDAQCLARLEELERVLGG